MMAAPYNSLNSTLPRFWEFRDVEQEAAAHDERKSEYESDGDTDEEGFQCDREHVGSGHYEIGRAHV